MSCVVMLAVEKVPGFRSPMLRLAIGSILATSGLAGGFARCRLGLRSPSSSVTFQTQRGTSTTSGSGANVGNNPNPVGNGGTFTFANPVTNVPGPSLGNPWQVLNLSPSSGGFFEGITGLFYTQTPSLSYANRNDPTFLFGQFYFLGNCSICGTVNTQGQIISIAPTTDGSVTRFGPPGQAETLTATAASPIIYGDTGISGTVSFNATALVSNNSSQFVIANVNFSVFDNPPGVVPGPVPLFGAAAAFGYSRKLRRRVALSREILS